MTAVTTKGNAHPPDALDCYLKFICLVFMVINTCFYIMLVEGLADYLVCEVLQGLYYFYI